MAHGFTAPRIQFLKRTLPIEGTAFAHRKFSLLTMQSGIIKILHY